jgi:tellurite resistance protein TerC
VDLLVFNREAHEISLAEATWWSIFWIALALAFNVGVWLVWGATHGGTFLAGYLLEKSLSVDNLFVFSILFTYFGIPDKYQHRVLFWGIFGALVMRGLMIFAGVALVQRFEWVFYIFGAFLVMTGLRMLLRDDLYQKT